VRTEPKLLIIGLDAADRHLVQQWSADGTLPTLGRLMEQSAWGDSKNPTGVVAGTVWPTFFTGVMPGRSGRFRGTTQFVSGTYQHADINRERYAFPTFWDVLAENGRRCLIVDAPSAFLTENSRVTQLVDWCSHAPWKDGVTVSRPGGLAELIRTKYGRDPIGKCDFATLGTVDDIARFRDGLIERIGMRTRLTMEYLRGPDLDVFLNVFSECHCAGHQLWHLHDPAHPQHDSAMVNALGGDPVKAVYAAMDAR
jgi:predicted AlkP superfamily phosphohydrolase/phosphomutase